MPGQRKGKGVVIWSTSGARGQAKPPPPWIFARTVARKLTFMKINDGHKFNFPAELIDILVSFLPLYDELNLRLTSLRFYENVEVRGWKPVGKGQLLNAELSDYAMRQGLWACFLCEKMLLAEAFDECLLKDGEWVWPIDMGGTGKNLPDHRRVRRYCEVCEKLITLKADDAYEELIALETDDPRAFEVEPFVVRGKYLETCTSCRDVKEEYLGRKCATCYVHIHGGSMSTRFIGGSLLDDRYDPGQYEYEMELHNGVFVEMRRVEDLGQARAHYKQ